MDTTQKRNDRLKRKPIKFADPMRPSLVDEVRRLFDIYKRATGAEPMAGGAQNLIRLAEHVCEPVDLFAERRKLHLLNLPPQVLIEILSYLDADDLCCLAAASRQW